MSRLYTHWEKFHAHNIDMRSTFKLVGDGSSLEEGLISLTCGILYGATSVIVGHPFDTVKTKMQADSAYAKLNSIQTTSQIFHKSGVSGFYAGALQPLFGSLVFRSIQFASYGATFAYFREESHILRQTKIGGVEGRVFVSGVVSGACRALIESPLDLMKTRQQTSSVSLRSIPISDLFRGFSATLSRNILLMTTFFIFADRLSHMDSFIRGGVSTTAAWTLVWPLDVAKSRMQSVATTRSSSLYSVVAEAARDGTLYRGYAVGILRSFVANGASLRAYQFGQEKLRKIQHS